ncbi:MAG TPA: 2-iminoacetate synthase ThiH [Verrucomicrobiae bacterium]|nr:2-iminoacetate synthase ThiH [Verrucomicrobiae bacterium]
MFYDRYLAGVKELEALPTAGFRAEDVSRALSKDRLDTVDLLALLSPAAEPFLEDMAQKANRLTLQQFGRAVTLFTPLYLANHCTNRCVYCSFNHGNSIERRKLSLDEVKSEGLAIAGTGLQHILLLTGESRKESGPDYMRECVEVLRPHFSSVGLEVYPLEEEEYRELYRAGVDALTMFQEAYDETIYAKVHPAGPKSNHRFRLDAPERACRAGIPSVTIGALLGLGEWRREAYFTALHAEYLQRNYPGVEVAISIPRLRPYLGTYQPETSPVFDASLVQILLAYRLFLPRVGLVLSTRESPKLRESLLPLGITRMSAGSLASVGGYAEDSETGPAQFQIADERSVAEIAAMLRSKGYQPTFCDWVDFRRSPA